MKQFVGMLKPEKRFVKCLPWSLFANVSTHLCIRYWSASKASLSNTLLFSMYFLNIGFLFFSCSDPSWHWLVGPPKSHHWEENSRLERIWNQSYELTDSVNARLDHRGCKEVDEGWAVESVGAVLVNPGHNRLVAVPTNKEWSYGLCV